jgi:hypothetical protein
MLLFYIYYTAACSDCTELLLIMVVEVVEHGGKLRLYDFCSWLKLECWGATLKVADRGVATLQLANCGDEPE